MFIKQITAASLLSMILALGSTVVQADIVVVVHPSNNVSLDVKSVRRIFLSKSKAFPNGNKIDVYDLPFGNTVREDFRETVLRKSESRLNAYWARMLFSSKARPPVVLSSADEVKVMIANNPNAIAYMDSADVDQSVKVVLSML